MLTQDVQSYLTVRRAMGFALHSEGTLLQSFAAFSEGAGKTHVCTETAIEWAGLARSITTRARRLGQVIRFAIFSGDHIRRLIQAWGDRRFHTTRGNLSIRSKRVQIAPPRARRRFLDVWYAT